MATILCPQAKVTIVDRFDCILLLVFLLLLQPQQGLNTGSDSESIFALAVS